MAALIEKATGIQPFYVGKPNPLMIRTALNYLHAHSEETVMIGDRMDTDIVGAVSSGLDTILVLSGVTQAQDIAKFPYQPTYVLDSIADMVLAETGRTEESELVQAEKKAAEASAADKAGEDAARKPRRQLDKVKS